MTSQRKGVQKCLKPSIFLKRTAMPTADAVAAERASEAKYERALQALLQGDGAAPAGRAARPEPGDSSGSEGELRMSSVLHALRRQRARAPRPPPAAAVLLPPLAAALRAAHPHDARFLDEYRLLLDKRSAAEVQALTDELMRSVEGALAAGEGAGGAVLASWLGAAVVWRAPRVPAALPALHCLLRQLGPSQVAEVARALHAALEPRELIAASDALRAPSAGRLPALLLRAASAKLLRLAPDWQAEALAAAEVRTALAERWSEMDAEAQLVGLALAGRVLANGARGQTDVLLAALAPPPPKDRLDPDYLKVNVAVKTLQNLLNA